MAGSLSNYARNRALDYVIPETTYVGFLTDEEATTPSTEATSVNCPGYSRKAVAHNAADNGIKVTAADVVFIATGDWTPFYYVGVWDAPTNGNLLYWAETGSEKLVFETDKVTVHSGNLSVSISQFN